MPIRERRNEDGDVFRDLVLDGGNRYGNLDCINQAERATRAFQRWFHRTLETATTWTDPDMVEDDVERFRWLLDDLETYIRAAHLELDAREGRRRQEERIKALRRVAGRSPEEASAYLAKADELERELGAP